MIYFDSSSLIKHYVAEAGSEVVDRLMASASDIYACWLTFAECHAAFSRLARERLLTEDERTSCAEAFDDDWDRMRVLQQTTGMEPVVRQLLCEHPLTGADSTQLAGAMFLRQRGIETTFVCSDRRLANIAHEEALTVLTPGLD